MKQAIQQWCDELDYTVKKAVAMEVYFSTVDVFYSFCKGVHPLISEMLADISMAYGPLVVTSAHRPGDKGVHGCLPTRGLDIRSRGYDEKEICAIVNRRWAYDPGRPNMKCAIFHDVGMGQSAPSPSRDRGLKS